MLRGSTILSVYQDMTNLTSYLFSLSSRATGTSAIVRRPAVGGRRSPAALLFTDRLPVRLAAPNILRFTGVAPLASIDARSCSVASFPFCNLDLSGLSGEGEEREKKGGAGQRGLWVSHP